MKRLAGSILLALLFAMLSAPAQAAINDIRFADSGIGLEFGAKDFKYGEDVGEHNLRHRKRLDAGYRRQWRHAVRPRRPTNRRGSIIFI